MKNKSKRILSLGMILIFVTPYFLASSFVVNAENNPQRYLSGIEVKAEIASAWSDKEKYNDDFYEKIRSEYEENYNSEETALKIHNPGQIAAFAKSVNDGKSFEGKYVKLMENIDLSGSIPKVIETSVDSNGKFSITIDNPGNSPNGLNNVWTPIGNDITVDTSFKGTFDGNHMKISNMVVLQKSSEKNVEAGLFGSIKGGTIKNVNIYGNSFVISSTKFTSSTQIPIITSLSGGIAAKASQGSSISDSGVIGCRIYSAGEGENTSAYSGGIAGMLSESSYIKNSSNEGGIVYSSAHKATYAGGIVSYADYSDNALIGCGSSSNVYSYSSANSLIGGLTGEFNGNITSSYSSGKVNVLTLNSTSLTPVGGLVGRFSGGTIDSCYSSGDINVNSSGPTRVGGIAGETMPITRKEAVIKSYSSSNIRSSSSSGSNSASTVGGLIGYASSISSVKDNYFAGDVYSSSSTPLYAGGLIGYASGGTITSNYSVGMVLAESGATPVSTGGIMGRIKEGASLEQNYYNKETSSTSSAVGYEGDNYSSSNPGLTTNEMTGKGAGRADEKMTSLQNNIEIWEFNEDSKDPVKLYYPSLKNVSAELPYFNGVKSGYMDVKGWQTPVAEHYEAKITWGDMVFVYDKGAFNENTTKLGRATTDDEFSGIEAGATDGEVNKWYGFNGINNKVKVENLSTSDIKTTASTSLNSLQDISGTTTLQLYFESSGEDSEKWKSASDENESPSAFEKVAYNGDGTPNDGSSNMKTYGIGKSITYTMPSKKFNEDGMESDSLNKINSGEFFLNIAGSPGSNFSSNSANIGELGKITLNFQIV